MPSPSAVWQPAAEVLAELGPAGRALWLELDGAFEMGPIDGAQVLEACRAADVLAALRAEDVPDTRQIRLWSSYFTNLLRALGLSS